MDKTYVEINLDTLRNNAKEIIKKYNDYKYYFGVVKSNASPPCSSDHHTNS